MSYTLRVPTSEQYAYIEQTFDGTQEEAVEEYKNLTSLVKGYSGSGLETKQFNKCLDEYITTGTLIDGADLYATMSKSQQDVFQELKKAFKRINKD